MASEGALASCERPSFAKVCDNCPPQLSRKQSPFLNQFPQVAAMHPLANEQPFTARYTNSQGVPSDPANLEPIRNGTTSRTPDQLPSNPLQKPDATETQSLDSLSKAVDDFHLVEQVDRGGNSESSGDGREDGVLKVDGPFEDDQTHLSNSSTKPTSFDSKSMASVTTFAMDEKESLRPDDSASVQAAEEDDSFSGPASGAPNSQVGSEAGGRLYRLSEQTGTSDRIPGRLRLNDAVAGGPFPADILSSQNAQLLHGFPKDPDEKLLEAMNSPKDRLLLLQLEEKIVAFIKDSRQLPPCNAFGRLLAHKLGDYYHLTHFVDNNVTSVRLHRTPWSRLPTPLSVLHATNVNKTPPLAIPAMKIMRRVGQPGDKASASGSTAASSSAPSKATSETGGEGCNDDERNGAASSSGATPAKERTALTREEREAKYQEARERIFRDFPESKSSENSNSGDHSTNISRSNSATGRRKNFRQRTPHDDSFEARSQFNAYYPGVPYSTGPPPFSGVMHDSSFVNTNNFAAATPSSPPSVNFSQTNQGNMFYQQQGGMNSMHQYQLGVPSHLGQNSWQPGAMQQPSYPGFYPTNHLPPMSQQSSARSSPAMNSYVVPNTTQYQQPHSTWNQPQFQPTFSPASAQRNPPTVHWPSFPPQSMSTGQVPYHFGQVPGQPFPQNLQHGSGQHPLPGNFSHSSFNPQTRSFIPGNAGQARFSGHTSQRTNNPHFAPAQFQPQAGWPNSQDHNTHTTNHPHSRPGNMSGPHSSTSHHSAHGLKHDSIAKWGTPSHLPPKPPPSEVSYDFELKNRVLPPQVYPGSNNTVSTQGPKNGPLVVSGGGLSQTSKPLHGAKS
ncbi:hypothetical protein AJ80_04226 [Polytolypa hystricis UAMH7299]|uniref:SUZ domain-containing protein n=1 Tax=Polytolypa hystricis (strain UAMH7299) TaxID=1447883 RepID=A0A2B7YC86_POLH7|nr:hypothetical protein AJ80_04226 [Polytolypa hystricis UAMH7299]